MLLVCFAQLSLAQSPINFGPEKIYISGYHIRCHGQNANKLFAEPAFGTPPYTYLWSTGATGDVIYNVPAGIYYLTITDANQLVKTDTFELKQPEPLSYQADVTDFNGYNVDKLGGTSGIITLYPNGGTPPYRIFWQNGNENFKRKELSAGTYNFTITDANGCTLSNSVVLTEPGPMQVSFSNIQSPTCFGNKNGAATINITGGVGSYRVAWSNGSSSLTKDELQSGYNVVSIFELDRLVLDTGVNIPETPPLEINFSLSQYNGFNVSCVDCFNGSITATISGGTAPYTYQWNDVSQSTTPNLSNLNGGYYELTITDVYGCETKNETFLTMPNPKDWSRNGNSNIDTSEFIGSTDTSAVVFKTNSQEALRLMGNGNVGVGTASPTEKLEVNGILKAQGLKLNNLNFKFHAVSGNIPESITWGAEDNAPWGAVNNPIMPSSCIDPLNALRVNVFKGAAVFKTIASSQTCSTFDPTFYVGLYGCDGALEVVQDGTVMSNGNTSGLNKLLLNTLCGRDVLVGRTDGGNLIVNHNLGIGTIQPLGRLDVRNINNNAAFLITSTGLVGIGTNTPSETLHVQGKTWLNGDVHIGDNANPNNKLVVEGKVYAREFHVNEANNWPDYVFSKKYHLTPLLEVEQYINKHGHLSEIPSQHDIEANGIALTELLTLQMKKIEELTLYIIELQKQQETLQLQVNNLTK